MSITRRQAWSALAGVRIATGMPPSPKIEPGLCSGNSDQPEFVSYCFIDDKAVKRQLYVADGGGPPVILLHELPGLVDSDLQTCRLIAGKQYTVIAPLMFGKPGGKGDVVHNYRAFCGIDEFACHQSNTTSTHVCWLRQLCGAVHERWTGGKGVGVIGMCLTGAFPIALLSEPSVVAPVICQPTTPVNFWTYFGLFTDERALGLYQKDLDIAKAAVKSRNIPLLGLRYKGDWRCRKPRFERLAEEFGSNFFRLDLPGKHHSTMAIDRCDDALMEVIAFFNQHLRSKPDTAGGSFPIHSKPGMKNEVTVSSLCASPGHH